MNPLTITLLLLGVFIYVAEGVAINPFAIWNALPLYLGYVLHSRARRAAARPARWGAVGFLAAGVALSGVVHLAWMFDWGEIKTGSSTAGLVLLFLPVYAVIAGGMGYLVGWGIGRITARVRT